MLDMMNTNQGQRVDAPEAFAAASMQNTFCESAVGEQEKQKNNRCHH